jgi:hypothetical protein
MADKPKEIRFTPSPRVWAYLQWLADNTLLGDTPTDVAHQLLLRQLNEMKGDEYKNPKL